MVSSSDIDLAKKELEKAKDAVRQIEERLMRLSKAYKVKKLAMRVGGPAAVILFFLLGVWLGG